MFADTETYGHETEFNDNLFDKALSYVVTFMEPGNNTLLCHLRQQQLGLLRKATLVLLCKRRRPTKETS